MIQEHYILLVKLSNASKLKGFVVLLMLLTMEFELDEGTLLPYCNLQNNKFCKLDS